MRRVLINASSRRFLACGVIAALGFATASGQSATPPQQDQRQVFRGSAVFVNVDVYPRRDGRVIEGLTKDDFEVLEDGKPQPVEKFEFVKIPPFTPDADFRDPTSQADAERLAADPHNRLFVVYLDIFHTSYAGSHYSRPAIMTFLRRTMGPGDLFGVMTPEVPITRLTFGRRTETLESELEKYWFVMSGREDMEYARNPLESRLMACNMPGLLTYFREDATATSLEAMVARLGALRDTRKNVLFISEGWRPRSAPRPGTATGGRPALPKIGMGPGGTLTTGSDIAGFPDRSWCQQQLDRLARLDYERRFKDLLANAQRANVAFFTVDVGGLKTTTPGSHGQTMAASDTMLTLAHETGGSAIFNTNDLASGVKKIADDLSAFYLLGYYSTNSAADGKFRRIEVRVKSPGARVTARRGYLAPTPELLKAEAAALAAPAREPTAVDDARERLGRLVENASLFTAAQAASDGLDVTVEIAARAMTTGRWTRGAAVVVSAAPDGGGAMTAEARLPEGTRSIRVHVPAPGAAGRAWSVTTRVGGGADLIESATTVSPAARSRLGEPAVFRALGSPRAPLLPAAEPQFRRTERLRLQWITSGPFDARTARLVGPQGAPLPVPVQVTEQADGRWLIADLTLAPLAAGDYVIEVAATRGVDTFTSWFAFRVLR
jgi:VWFA-related protein